MKHPRLDHGAIGNGRVLALVSPMGAIEWLCLPTLSSPSVFARLLDHEIGGSFGFRTPDEEIPGRLAYVVNTNVLVNRFEKDGAAWEVVDFAPRIPHGIDVLVPVEIVRIVRPLFGAPRLRVVFDPRPDYARATPEFFTAAEGLDVVGGAQRFHLATNLPLPYVTGAQEFLLERPIFFVFSIGPRDEPPTLASVTRDMDLTVAGWQEWVKSCSLPTFAPEEVLRSALCLKLHACHDTGAIIAAATTSIPEAMGTERTWDYRYCWLRDAAFVVEALRRMGHLAEGEKFLQFLRHVAESGPLQPLYGINGERVLVEEFLPHLAGFGGNGFVRIGNAAWEHRQNDLMGEIILCFETTIRDPRIVNDAPERHMSLVQRFVEEAIAAAPTDDTGIWEYRTVLRQHTFSRAMCWAAIHRGAVLARRFGQPELARTWEGIAERERSIVLEQGFNHELGFFSQGLLGRNPDASNLLLPAIGLIDGRDPRFVSTVDAYDRLLSLGGGLLLRYRNEDDFGIPTSAFTICSFWMAEALALSGRLDEAVDRFRTLLRYANPVGLFSEDVDPADGTLLGNFPQAYTHVGLIHAAMTIGSLLETREGRVRAWV